jgi:hypothetical protein
MGLFSGAGGASISQGGVYFEPGRYKVKVKKTAAQRSQKNGKNYFIVEAEILESDNPKRKPGSTASQVIDIGNIMGFPNIKAYLAAANGIDPTDTAAVDEALGTVTDDRGKVTRDLCEEAAEYAVSEDNPLEGTILDLECVEILTKDKRPFTKHIWSPSEELLAQLANPAA